MDEPAKSEPTGQPDQSTAAAPAEGQAGEGATGEPRKIAVLTSGGDAYAAAYVEVEVGRGDDAVVLWGVGIDPDITTATLKAAVSAVNRA